jgi:hypothetical protein
MSETLATAKGLILGMTLAILFESYVPHILIIATVYALALFIVETVRDVNSPNA